MFYKKQKHLTAVLMIILLILSGLCRSRDLSDKETAANGQDG